MTDKQERILAAALELFANHGYDATSTSRIAKVAKVSEGLIFRHFENKKGLLDALMKEAENRLLLVFKEILDEKDPKAVIRKTLELPFSYDEAEFDFWKLQFKLKWEQDYHNPDKVKPLIDKLTEAFTQLNVAHPEHEALLLSQLIEIISTEILRSGLESQLPLKPFLMEKYGV